MFIRVKVTSICGTDVHIDDWDPWAQKNVPVPLVIGHEFVGEIASVGEDVNRFHVGQRVSGEGHLTCGKCKPCREGHRHLCSHVKGIGYHVPGCFAEYLVLPAENVVPIPDAIPDEIATLLDPLGNAVHTAYTFPIEGKSVLVTGAGPIGLMAALLAQRAGASHVILSDPNPYRLKLAEQLGIVECVYPQEESLHERFQKLGISEGCDIGFEMSGNPKALEAQIKRCVEGGKIALLGIIPEGTGINWPKLIFKMLTLKGIYGREIFATWERMLELLQEGLDLRPLITHRFHYTEFKKGFDVMRSGESGKVLLTWD